MCSSDLRAWRGRGAVALPAPGQSLAEGIEQFAPTHVSLVATQLRRLLSDAASRERLCGMKAVLLGGSAFPEALIAEAHAAELR